MNKIRNRISAILCALFASALLFGCGQNGGSVTFGYAPAMPDSPLRGFAVWNTPESLPFEYSLEYLPVRLDGVYTVSGETDFSSVDSALDKIAKRGNNAIMRVVLWEPPYVYLPAYFAAEGVSTVTAGNVQVPDFSDEKLIELLCGFISKLGQKYDGDPRIGFLQLGLIGRWGEWNYGPAYPADKIPGTQQYDAVYAAFDNAFDITKTMARNPNMGNAKNYKMGYHDDNFMFSTLGSGSGDFKYLAEHGGISAELFKTESFGAELSGNENGDFFSTADKKTRFTDSVKYMNLSFMMWQKYDELDSGIFISQKSSITELSRLLGYEIGVTKCGYTYEDGKLKVSVTLKNTGGAPFYYDWNGRLLVRSGEAEISETKPLALSAVMPSESKVFDFSVELSAFDNNTKVYFSIENPLTESFAAAKKFRLANKPSDLTEDGALKIL